MASTWAQEQQEQQQQQEQHDQQQQLWPTAATFLEQNQKIVGAIIIIFNTAAEQQRQKVRCIFADACGTTYISPGFSGILWVPGPYFMGCLQRRRMRST